MTANMQLAPPAGKDEDIAFFGTDGIRGRVGTPPITPDFVLRLGYAVGKVMRDAQHREVVIGKDTRRSGYMFESALEAGLAAAGADIAMLGPLPTPATAYLTRTLNACAGLVISASHNPYHDNGIKLFGMRGEKLTDAQQQAITAMLMQLQAQDYLPMTADDPIGKARRIDDATGRYVEFCKSTFPAGRSLDGVTMVLDCANGAAYQAAPAVFNELGANVIAIHNQPDGSNINRDCGSTAISSLQQAVLQHSADLGIAFDGDADRVQMVDHLGRLVDGDGMLYVLACHYQQRGMLDEQRGVVGTLMSNEALARVLHQRRIAFVRERVGDRYVQQRLEALGWQLGGETAGHILCLDKTPFGDGIIAALQVLAALADSNSCLADAMAGLQLMPQVLINVPLQQQRWAELSEARTIVDVVTSINAELHGHGRLVLRPSGTEPVIRVMVEHDRQDRAGELAQQLAVVIRETAAG
jgi:phosphoglucosamine mutase